MLNGHCAPGTLKSLASLWKYKASQGFGQFGAKQAKLEPARSLNDSSGWADSLLQAQLPRLCSVPGSREGRGAPSGVTKTGTRSWSPLRFLHLSC